MTLPGQITGVHTVGVPPMFAFRSYDMDPLTMLLERNAVSANGRRPGGTSEKTGL
jgi:hypothetical protein